MLVQNFNRRTNVAMEHNEFATWRSGGLMVRPFTLAIPLIKRTKVWVMVHSRHFAKLLL